MRHRRCLLFLGVLALLAPIAPATARAQWEGRQVTATLFGSLPVQSGPYGDIYERSGRGGGAEVEFMSPQGWASVAIFEDMSFKLGPTGHVINGTADTLVGGVPGSLSLGRGALRYYWGRSRLHFFGEGGLGTGIVKADYTIYSDLQDPGEYESLVFDAFAGLGVRWYVTDRLGGTLGVRIDGATSIEGDRGVLASVYAGLSLKIFSVPM